MFGRAGCVPGLITEEDYSNLDTVEFGGWPITPVLGSEQPQRILFSGVAQKSINGQILSTGSSFINRSGIEYRAVRFAWKINYADVMTSEVVESDVCLIIVSEGVETSLSSGEEVLCAHEHFNGSDNTPLATDQKFPGGFVVDSGSKLSVSGVSNIFPNTQNLEDIVSGRIGGPFLSIEFQVELVRADKVSTPGLMSVRSPQRDRSIVVSNLKETSPYTSYVNNSVDSVNVHGVGVFISALDSITDVYGELSVLVNDELIINVCLPAHEFHKTSVSSSYAV